MTADRTDLQWHYEPRDFFEADCEHEVGECLIVVRNGIVTATVAGGIPNREGESRITAKGETVFRARLLQVRRPYSLKGPTFIEHVGDKRHRTIRLEPLTVKSTGGTLDVIRRDAVGNVVSDTKAERIAAHQAEINVIAGAARSPAVEAMLRSASASINDRANELVHLYEIRDALVRHFGSADAARSALSISSSEWSTFGRLANDEPLLEGRHRGKHVDELRPATNEELNLMRRIARDWITRFADNV